MSDATPPATPEPTPPRQPAPRRSGGGLFGRLLAALLVIIITTALAVAAVAGLLLWLGYRPDTATGMDAARAQIATVQAQNAELTAQNRVMQTAIAEQDRRESTARETLDELRQEVSALSDLRGQVAEREATMATVAAEARDSRDQVVLFATAEAGRAALLDELNRRSARVERFIQRLGDISNDASADLAPPVTPSATAGESGALTPTSTTAPEATPTASPSRTPTTTATP